MVERLCGPKPGFSGNLQQAIDKVDSWNKHTDNEQTDRQTKHNVLPSEDMPAQGSGGYIKAALWI